MKNKELKKLKRDTFDNIDKMVDLMDEVYLDYCFNGLSEEKTKRQIVILAKRLCNEEEYYQRTLDNHGN